jgi:NADH-quinone oxidoreductase subunit N
MDGTFFNLTPEALAALFPILFLCGTLLVSIVMAGFKLPGKYFRIFGVLSFSLFAFFHARNLWLPDQGILGSSLFVGFLVKTTGVVLGILAALAALFTLEDEHPEWLPLLMVAVVGLNLVVGARDWVSFFVYLETFALPSYVLAAFRLRKDAGFESGIKYLMMGAFSSALFLLGITLLYGFSGTFDYLSQLEALSGLNNESPSGLVYAGFSLIVVSLGFKLALAPFHMWAPDVYQSAPSSLAGFLSTAVKFSVFVAAFAAFSQSGLLQVPFFQAALSALGVLSIVIGNLMALRQINLRRMAAYASIASAGYAALAFAAGPVALSSVLVYLAIYGVNVMALFAILDWAARTAGLESSSQVDLPMLKAALKDRPVYLFFFGCILFSLVGLPPLPGFIGKFLFLRDLLRADLYVEAGVLLLGSLMALAYYLRIFVPIAFEQTTEELALGSTRRTSMATSLGFFVSSLVLILSYWGFLEYFRIAAESSVFLR